MAFTGQNALVKPSVPLRLKRVLFNAHYAQAALAREIALPTSTLAQIINYNIWPSNKSAAELREQIKSSLQAQGVQKADMVDMWEFDDDPEPVTYAGHLRRANANTFVPPESKNKAQIIHDDLPENAMLTQKAKQHFHLFQDPFTDDVLRPEDVFSSADQQYVKGAMYQTAKRGGFIAVIGESGAGKTTLRKDLLDRINREEPSIRIVFPQIIDKTRINASSICDAILDDMHVQPKSSLEAKARQIKTLLANSSRNGNSHCIMIEEAHDIPLSTLKYLKRFWEMEDGFRKLVSIILIGQPELKNNLNEQLHPEIREVARRCELIELQPLGQNLDKYLELKFQRVGKQLPEIFDPSAYDAIRNRLSVHRGNSRIPVNMAYPLVVNNLVTASMNACVELGEPRISADIIKEL